MTACGVPNYEWVDARSVPQCRQETAQLSDYVKHRNGWAQGVRGKGDAQTVGVQALREEGVQRPIAPLPVTAVHVYDQRRTCATGEEQVVAIPVARSITPVELGIRRLAIGGRRGLPTRRNRIYLRDAPAIVVLDLIVGNRHGPPSVSPPIGYGAIGLWPSPGRRTRPSCGRASLRPRLEMSVGTSECRRHWTAS